MAEVVVSQPTVAEMPGQKDLHPMLKNGTKERHEQAENCHFIQMVVKRRVSKELYAKFVASLYFIYDALEEMGELNKDHPVYGPTYFPVELNRKAALEKDLEYYYGKDWKNQIVCSTETKNYVDRIKELGRSDPALLVPHAYARYLGDLSGGQILKPKIIKGLALPKTGEGVNFYDFPEIDNFKQFKQFYTGRLNSLDTSADIAERIEEEARNAFLCNIKLFQEMDNVAKGMPNGYLEKPLTMEDNDDIEKEMPADDNHAGNGAGFITSLFKRFTAK